MFKVNHSIMWYGIVLFDRTCVRTYTVYWKLHVVSNTCFSLAKNCVIYTTASTITQYSKIRSSDSFIYGNSIPCNSRK